MRLLLTGAGGFVGSHILRHVLVNTDWEVVVLDSFRHKGKTDRLTQQMEGLDKTRVHVEVHDLRVPMSDQLIQRIGAIDYIINCASESHVERSIDDPRNFIENNVSLVLTMLEYARIAKTKKFIQVSTDEVYGPAPLGYNHDIHDPHRPSNPYSASKAAQEDICYAYWRTYGLPIAISNTMNIIGELQDIEKFVPMIIRNVQLNREIMIHAGPDGTIGTRYYLHARNQADALLYLLNNVHFALYGEGDMPHFHVVGEKEVDNLTLAQLIAAFMGKPLCHKLVDFHSSRPGHDLRYALNGRTMTEVGWVPPYSLEDSLKQTVEWTLQHPEWLL